MSAIWGSFSMEDKKLSIEKRENMKKPFDKYKIDRMEELVEEDFVLGCGLQYFTKESQYENLPFAEAKEIYFTADGMVDNRAELLEKLNLQEETRVIPDGEILYKLYKKYGNECLNWILGSYVFVYYNRKEKEAYVVSDAAGTRCLYYRYQDGVFEFSSVLESFYVKEEKRKVNERWLADFIGLDNLVGITECEETIYQDIYKVEPAHVLKISSKGIEKKRYWNPNPKELKLASEEEYRKRFIEIFGEVVRGLLRADKTALLLSGGLDSSSIACFAAPELKKRGEKLYTFTSVPEEDYVSDRSAYNVTDESSKVKKTAEFLGNLECHFVNLSGKNPWTAHYKIKEGIEIPYKSVQNLQWIVESLEQAYQTGARIMLEGGYGNVTISYGNPVVYLNTLLSKGRFISFIKELQCFAKRYRWNKKKKYKIAIQTIQDFYFSKENPKEQKESILGKSYIKKEKSEELNLGEKIFRLNRNRNQSKMEINKVRKLMVDNIQLSHKGEIKTKESLMTGVLFRDPCMDKRVIEFCMSLPMEQYCYQGMTRRVVRKLLEGIVPDHIIKVDDYGCQSADMLLKIQKNWAIIKDDLKDVFLRNENNEMIDTKAALEDIEVFGKDIIHQEIFDFTRLFYTAMVLETMEEN